MKKVFIFSLLIIMAVIVSMSNVTYALTPVSTNYVQLDGVYYKEDGVTVNKLWILMDDGYWYLDYDGSGTLGNGLVPLSPTAITFESTNNNYKKLEFYNPTSGNIIGFDLIKLIYVSFVISYNSSNDSFTIYVDDDSKTLITGFNYIIRDGYIRIKDEQFESNETQAAITAARREGYDIGWAVGNTKGLETGFDNGVDYVFDNGLDSQGLDPLNSYDYSIIYQYLYENGFGASDETSFSYVQGYSTGLVQAETDNLSLVNFIPGILGVLVGFVLQIASVGFMGITLLDLLAAIVTIIGALVIFKIFVGK